MIKVASIKVELEREDEELWFILYLVDGNGIRIDQIRSSHWNIKDGVLTVKRDNRKYEFFQLEDNLDIIGYHDNE